MLRLAAQMPSDGTSSFFTARTFTSARLSAARFFMRAARSGASRGRAARLRFELARRMLARSLTPEMCVLIACSVGMERRQSLKALVAAASRIASCFTFFAACRASALPITTVAPAMTTVASVIMTTQPTTIGRFLVILFTGTPV